MNRTAASIGLTRLDRAPESAWIADWDAAVAISDDVDRFCSSSRWILPALDAFHPNDEPVVLSSDSGMAALVRGHHDVVGQFLTPMEATWGLASGLVAWDPDRFAVQLREALRDEDLRVSVALLSGLRPGRRLWRALVRELQPDYVLRPAATSRRNVASLDGGYDGWLGRRTRKFRANLRRQARRASDRGIEVEPIVVDDAETLRSLYDRAMALEAISWKGLSEQGVDSEPMRSFTFDVLTRSLHARDAEVRWIVARAEDRDIGYLHGVLAGRHFRGLQMSFADAWRDAGVGSLMQATAIRWLCDDGARSYDLGSELPYKARWAERSDPTVGLLCHPRVLVDGGSPA